MCQLGFRFSDIFSDGILYSASCWIPIISIASLLHNPLHLLIDKSRNVLRRECGGLSLLQPRYELNPLVKIGKK